MGGAQLENYKILHSDIRTQQVGYYRASKIDIYGLISRLIRNINSINVQPCRLCQKNLGDFKDKNV
jgi:hypothetical protein